MSDSPLATTFRVASEHRDQGRFPEARALLLRATASQPEAAALHVALGRVELEDRQWDDAARAFAQATELSPHDLDAAIGTLIALLRGRQVDHAQFRKIDGASKRLRTIVTLLQAADEIDLDDPDAAVWRLGAVRRLGLAELAAPLVDDTVQRHRDIAEAHHQRALIASERGDWEEAASGFEEASELDRDDVLSAVQHVHALRQLRRDADARATLERALALHPERPDLHIELALMEEDASRLHEAEAAFAAALALDGRDAIAALGRARVLRKLGRFDDAGAAATALHAVDPENPGPHVELGWIALEAHEYARALACFDRALGLDARAAGARSGRRRARRRSGGRPLARVRRSLDRRTWHAFSAWQTHRTVLGPLFEDDARRSTDVAAATDRLGWRYARLEALEDLMIEWLVLAWLAILVTEFAVVRRVLDPPHPLPGSGSIGEFVAFVALSLAFIALAGVLFTLTDRLRVLVGTTFVYAAAAAVLAAEGGHLPVALAYALECSFSVAASGIGVLFALVVPPALALTFVKWRLVKRRPEAAAMMPLTRLLSRARTRAAQLGSEQDIQDLEDAASAIRTCLRSRKPTGDRRTDAWLCARADGIATAIRELKMWLLTPGAETTAALEQRLMRDLRSIADGRWRELRWTDPEAATARKRRVLGIAVARNLIIAALPAVALLAFESFGWLHLNGGTADQALVAALGWALITLLITLDPHFQDKVGILQGSLKSFRPDR